MDLKPTEAAPHRPAQPSCAACGNLGEKESWGEKLLEPDVPAPPAFERLEWCLPFHNPGMIEPQVYRCPACGNYYEVHTVESDAYYGNSSLFWHTLSRHSPRSHADLAHPDGAVRADAARLLTLDCFKVGDLKGLDRLLLRHTDPAVRLGALDTLAILFDPGTDPVRGSGAPQLSKTTWSKTKQAWWNETVALDLTALEPTLREVLNESPDLAKAGARVLARHLLRQGRQAEVETLFESSDPAVRRGAVNAAWHAAMGRWAEVGQFLGHVRDFLGDQDQQSRSNAQEILVRLRGQAGVAAATVEDATRRLESALAEEREAAASVLAQVAHAGADISAALPHLASLVRSRTTAKASLKAIWEAALQGADVAVTLPALIEHLDSTSNPLGGATGTLVAFQERGGNISLAFGVLGKLACLGELHALTLLMRAAEKGADLGAAIEPLQKLVAKANLAPEERNSAIASNGDTAARSLTLHYARANARADVVTLLSGANPRVREAASLALRQLASGALGGPALSVDLARLAGAPTDRDLQGG